MSDTFFVNSPFVVSQDTSLYANAVNADTQLYDYILDINILATGSAWTTMNDMFVDRHFVQNATSGDGENNVDVTLSANVEQLDALLSINSVAVSSDNTSVNGLTAVYGTLAAGEHYLGLSMLEIVATKIFGHAGARAAITNDTDYYRRYNDANSLIQQIADGINGSLANKAADVFNEYSLYDRVQDNVDTTNGQIDWNAPAQFNFANTTWQFPIYFTSTLSSISGDALGAVSNGPVVGGNQLIDGSMNVPILLRFHS
jgi:hypothetical protein